MVVRMHPFDQRPRLQIADTKTGQLFQCWIDEFDIAVGPDDALWINGIFEKVFVLVAKLIVILDLGGQ